MNDPIMPNRMLFRHFFGDYSLICCGSLTEALLRNFTHPLSANLAAKAIIKTNLPFLMYTSA
jgi:hypothetical protein